MNKPFNMPVVQGNAGYAEAPNYFTDREYFVISYETEPEALQKILPPGMKAADSIVNYEFMHMPDASRFGRFCESGQVIPVEFEGVKGTYVHSMFLDRHPPIAGGREIWGFPKTLGSPGLEVDGDYLLGTLDYGKVRVATGTMPWKTNPLDHEAVKVSLGSPCFLVKNIPHVDGSPAICQLVQYAMTDITVKGAWSGEATLELHPHAMARVYDLPVKRVLSGSHFIADLTLPYGEVVVDYLKHTQDQSYRYL